MMETVSDSPSLRRWRRYPNYKPSGVEWLGEVPEGWEIVPLKRLLISNKGGVWGEDSYGNGTIILRSTEMTLSGSWQIKEPAYRKLTEKEFKSFLLKKGDLILTKSSGSKDHLGKTAEVTEEIEKLQCCYSNFMQRLRIKNNSASRFVYWHLNGICGREQLLFLGTTTTGLSNLTTEIIGDVLMPTPPLPEQHAITAFLDRETARIDDLIEKKERLIELLEEKRAALISHAVTKGLDPNVKMKDSGVEWIGEIPEHWEIKRLKYISPRISGRLVYSPAQYFTDEGVPFLFGINITKDGISFENLKYIPTEINTQFSKYALRKDDLVMVRVGEPGLTTVIPQEADGLNCASLMIIRKSENFDSQWLSHVLNSYVGQYQVKMTTYGATLEQINITDAVNFIIPTPPKEEQKKISNHLVKISFKIQLVQTQINNTISLLEEFRSALISAAVTGKIDVRQEALV